MASPVSDTSTSDVRLIKETAWGVHDPAGSMQRMRITSDSLNIELNSVESQELRRDRRVTDSIPTKYEGTGDIQGEFLSLIHI